MNERALVTKIQKYLKDKYFVWKTNDNFTSGIPDLVVIGKGRTIFLEVKKKDGKLSKIQEYMITRLKFFGAEVYVVRSLDDVREIFEPIINLSKLTD